MSNAPQLIPPRASSPARFRVILNVAVVGDTPHLFRFQHNEITIGSELANDIMLAHDSVSPRHARLIRRDDRYIIVDLKSDGGTWVNGRLVQAPTLITEDDAIRIGSYEVAVLDREPPLVTEKRFLDAIEATPMDDDTRSVYADWLEEQDRHDEAEFLRAQIEVKGMAPQHPRFEVLSKRITTLGPTMPQGWRRAVARPLIEQCDVNDAKGERVEHVRFELQCPQRWDQLQPTGSPGRRHCGVCKKDVHYASNIVAARRLAMAGECVAVDVAPEQRYPGDLDRERFGVTAGIIAPPRTR
jgi:uncharacterized protein (TIGR02996 family)